MVAVVWEESSAGGQDSWLLERHRVRGVWSAPHRLGAGSGVRAAIDGDGAITVAWQGFRGGSNVKVVTRSADGRWGAVHELARFGGAPELAMNHSGATAVAWATERGVGMAMRRRGQPGWRSMPPLRGAIGGPDPVRIALDDRGRALVLWGRSSENELGLARKHLAWSTTTGDGVWAETRYLDDRVRGVVEFMDLAMNARGQAVAVWTQGMTAAAARFAFGAGWTEPTHVEVGGTPAALVTPQGTALALLPGSWIYQRPGDRWETHPLALAESVKNFAAAGDGRQLTLLQYGDGLSVRVLTAGSS
jgi:hypothetical protein